MVWGDKTSRFRSILIKLLIGYDLQQNKVFFTTVFVF